MSNHEWVVFFHEILQVDIPIYNQLARGGYLGYLNGASLIKTDKWVSSIWKVVEKIYLLEPILIFYLLQLHSRHCAPKAYLYEIKFTYPVVGESKQLIGLFIILKTFNFLWFYTVWALELKRRVWNFGMIRIGQNSFHVPASHQSVTGTYRNYTRCLVYVLAVCEQMCYGFGMISSDGLCGHWILDGIFVVIELKRPITETDTYLGLWIWTYLLCLS